MPGRTPRVPGGLIQKAILRRARKHWQSRFPKKKHEVRKPSAIASTYLAMEGHIMLAVLLVAAVNALGHVYSTHRHEEVAKVLAERGWHKLQCQHTKHSLTQIQKSLCCWQHIATSAHAAANSRDAWSLQQSSHNKSLMRMLSYHLQQAELMQSKHTEASCAGLAILRQKYHTGLAEKLQASCQDHSLLQQQSQACQDMWQQIRQLSTERIHSLSQQHHTNMLQLVRHQFHQTYWNMQNTRRIVHSVHESISQNRQLTCTFWAPQTPSNMQRLDPF